jgi:hypothetical protein
MVLALGFLTRTIATPLVQLRPNTVESLEMGYATSMDTILLNYAATGKQSNLDSENREWHRTVWETA